MKRTTKTMLIGFAAMLFALWAARQADFFWNLMPQENYVTSIWFFIATVAYSILGFVMVCVWVNDVYESR